MYTWTAIYTDETKLDQFEEDKEYRFSDIRQDKLLAFKIVDGKRILLVDVKYGLFFINGTLFEIPNVSRKELDYRLIHFKRVTQSMGTAPGMQATTTNHFIGFQVTIDGKNKKYMAEVDKDCIVKLHM